MHPETIADTIDRKFVRIQSSKYILASVFQIGKCFPIDIHTLIFKISQPLKVISVSF